MTKSTKAEKVAKASVVREPGWLYYIDKDGNIARTAMARGGKRKTAADKPEIVAHTEVIRDANYIYFMDNDGDVARLKRNSLESPSEVTISKPKTRTPRRKSTVESKIEDNSDDEFFTIY